MKKLYEELSVLFPSKFHNYKLVLGNDICDFVTLHWSVYLGVFLVSTCILYAFLYWEMAYKYTNPFTTSPKIVVSNWGKIIVLLVCVGVSLIITGIPFILYSHDITKVSIDNKKREFRVYGVLLSESIPFKKVHKIDYYFKIIENKSTKSGSTTYSPTIQIKTDASDTPILIYHLWGKLEGTEETKQRQATEEASKVCQILRKYLKITHNP